MGRIHAMASGVAITTLASSLLSALFTPYVEGAIPIDCNKLLMKDISTCIPYLTGKVMTLPIRSCCPAMKALNKLTDTQENRQSVCECIRDVAAKTPAFRPDRPGGLNGACDTTIPLQVFINSGCSSVK
ncbi:hypothetical protein H6P81_017194 [Aristolochia fimbriata]|uniref:Bifunctional inhibitor/plant lipid transfer protein/seed storage helical domain-containing protein n=1 Tax=Aristolochia fimbriata TaxID=158543 RepID=A0AAV7DZF8_ARIFI|nr:hypothetical protein H6P81_017194 [Aristolochia fimbriata]